MVRNTLRTIGVTWHCHLFGGDDDAAGPLQIDDHDAVAAEIAGQHDAELGNDGCRVKGGGGPADVRVDGDGGAGGGIDEIFSARHVRQR